MPPAEGLGALIQCSSCTVPVQHRCTRDERPPPLAHLHARLVAAKCSALPHAPRHQLRQGWWVGRGSGWLDLTAGHPVRVQKRVGMASAGISVAKLSLAAACSCPWKEAATITSHLERPRRNLLARCRHADDHRLAPAAVRTLKGGAHDLKPAGGVRSTGPWDAGRVIARQQRAARYMQHVLHAAPALQCR